MLLTVADIARRLGISEKAGRKLVQNLPAVRIGKRDRYPEAALAEYIARGGCRPAERPAT